jgi:2,4-dienoyl-CoA reductase-like NADH-dependent reductase (Old Yellow Enzyme family)/pyruvate/2-oxoglutarate dehydrogenase complex dihydrolipoamide dehydrogenase (E3) component
MTLTKVFEPITIRHLEVPNRIARTAHATGLASPPAQVVGGEFIPFQAARARGGVGLTIMEAIAVHPSSFALGVSHDGLVEGYQELMAAVRPHGMRVFQQIFHSGHIGPGLAGGPSWSVSSIPGVYGVVSQPMRPEQIEEIVAAYATAAKRCHDGGLDGVELHAGHGYLPHQFLSPLYNDRDDEYGGSLENRMRFTKEVLAAMREAVGDEFVVGIRLSASEMPGSIQEEELKTVIGTLEREGLIDYLTTSFGDHYRTIGNLEGMEAPVGYELPSAGQLARATSLPAIVTGRFRTLDEAEKVLQDGVAQLVSMVRAHIADPDIVRKTREGRAHEIRPCIACNQGCIGGTERYPPRMGCTVNPAAGFESELSEELITPVADPRRVLVVGGGPAGLEAARIAARCGHEVKLVEAGPQLGGTINVARLAPRYGLLGDIVPWLEAELQRAGVEVVLDTRLSAEDIIAEGADTVILATGSRPRMDGFQPQRPFEPARGIDQAHVLSSAELLTGGVPSGARTAVILDTVGHFEGVAAAEFLAAEGVAITYLSSLPSFAPLVQSTLRDKPALELLYEGDFTLLVRHHLQEVRAATALVKPLQSEKATEVAADVVVLVTQNAPNRELYDELLDAGQTDVHLIGDAASPRDIQVAIAEGHRLARAIGSRTAAGAA